MKEKEKEEWIEVFKTLKRKMPQESYDRILDDMNAVPAEVFEILSEAGLALNDQVWALMDNGEICSALGFCQDAECHVPRYNGGKGERPNLDENYRFWNGELYKRKSK